MLVFFCAVMGFFLSLAAVCSSSESATPTREEEMQWVDIGKIDQRIAELEQMKRGYESKALYHDNQAQRLQFFEGQFSLAQKHAKLADANRDVAKKIQEEIDMLKARKKDLLQRSTAPTS